MLLSYKKPGSFYYYAQPFFLSFLRLDNTDFIKNFSEQEAKDKPPTSSNLML